MSKQVVEKNPKNVKTIKRIRSSWDVDEPVDEDIYTEEVREQLVDDDELTPLEEAFMMGWEEAE